MTDEPTVYDLTLLLSNEAPEERRAEILSGLEAAIQRGAGSIVGRSNWGTRSLTFRIQRQTDAEFHLWQITGPPSLLEDLSHNLRITDGVLRFRIIKAVPGSRVAGGGEQAGAPAAPAAERAAAPAGERAAAPAAERAS
jgi:small subunit ribosomal protein S6